MNWKQISKQIIHWTVPPGFRSIIQSLVRQSDIFNNMPPADAKPILERNRKFNKFHNGERCFILATGPSLQKQDLKQLKGEFCIAVSNFFVHRDYNIIRPMYYCISNMHPPINEDMAEKWFREIESGVGNAIIFSAYANRNIIESNNLFSNHNVHYLYSGANWNDFPLNGINLTQPVYSWQSITVMALLIAIYMGFNHIYLLGCDHDHILHVGTSTHFYKENEHALVRNGYNEWSVAPDLEHEFGSYCTLWKQYKAIKTYTERIGIKIQNATAGGLLDVFERISYESLFQKDSQKFRKDKSL